MPLCFGVVGYAAIDNWHIIHQDLFLIHAEGLYRLAVALTEAPFKCWSRPWLLNWTLRLVLLLLLFHGARSLKLKVPMSSPGVQCPSLFSFDSSLSPLPQIPHHVLPILTLPRTQLFLASGSLHILMPLPETFFLPILQLHCCSLTF